MIKKLKIFIFFICLSSNVLFCESFSFSSAQTVHFIITQEAIIAEAYHDGPLLKLTISFDLEFLTPVPKVNSFPAYAMISNLTINDTSLPFNEPLIFEIEDHEKIKETGGKLITHSAFFDSIGFSENFFQRFFIQLMTPIGSEIAIDAIYPMCFVSLVNQGTKINKDSGQIQIRKQKKGWYFGVVTGTLETDSLSIQVDGKVRWKENDLLIQERNVNYFIEQRTEGASSLHITFKETWFSI